LHALVERLRKNRFSLLDIQWSTPHLRLFGAIEISRTLYRKLLAAALEEERSFID
jgi:leucyl/phenylalanyl-tRNA--protein transferase